MVFDEIELFELRSCTHFSFLVLSGLKFKSGPVVSNFVIQHASYLHYYMRFGSFTLRYNLLRCFHLYCY